MCQKINLSHVSTVAEGDFEFLLNTLLLFEKLLNSSEVGKYISFKMRRFYKNFQPPKVLEPQGTQEFVDYLKQQQKTNVQLYFQSQNMGLSKPIYSSEIQRQLQGMELSDRLHHFQNIPNQRKLRLLLQKSQRLKELSGTEPPKATKSGSGHSAKPRMTKERFLSSSEPKQAHKANGIATPRGLVIGTLTDDYFK